MENLLIKKVILGLIMLSASSLMATNINLYGVAHVSADSIDNGANSTVKIASNSSRLGIKGSQKINNDISVLGQFEVGVDLTGAGKDDGNGGDYNNTAAMFTSARDSFVGIKSDKAGMILAGNLPAINQWMYDYNLFADQIGDLGNIWGHSSAIGIDRASDTVAYFIPEFIKGLSGDIAYVSDLSATNDGNPLTAILVKVNYTNSGFKIGLGYVVADNKTVSPSVNPSDIAFTASYSADSFSVGGGFVHSDDDIGTDSVRDAYTLGGSFTISDITIKAQYSAVDAEVANSNSALVAIGIDYALAKDATVYIAYADTSNDSGVAYQSNNWGHGKSAYGTPATGDNSSSFSLGLVYKFGGTVYKN